MQRPRLFATLGIAILMLSFAAFALCWRIAPSQAAAAAPPLLADDDGEPPPLPPEEQPEGLTSGPVHEAFAGPVNTEEQDDPLVVPNEPPANIEEMPPAERPEGDGYMWVPGYWAWEPQRSGYIWVSACWRVAPPNRTWVPGYWNRVGGGWGWVAGFWGPAAAQEIEYLPAPPSLENVQAPVVGVPADRVWVPPCYYWQQGRYVLRAGYWLQAYPGWVWVPSHYTWTPRGYVFVAGHWDYSLPQRGVLFAPVRFPRPVRAGFVFSPSLVVDIDVLTVNLFTAPRYRHYYFGDYYDDSFIRFGIYPWFDREHIRGWYDPIYVHERWRMARTEPRWEERQHREYELRRGDKALRPPRTYREMETRIARLPEPQRRNIELARPLTTVVKNKTTNVRFERINTDVRKKLTIQGTEVHKFQADRSRWEATAESKVVEPKTPPDRIKTPTPPDRTKITTTPPRPVKVTKPERVKIPSPPMVIRPGPREKELPKRPTDEDKRGRQ